MGWLWASPPAPKGSSNPSATTSTTNPDAANKPSPAPAQAPAKQPEPEYDDPEVAKFMAELQGAFSGSNNPPPSSSTSSSHPPTSTSSSRTIAEPPQPQPQPGPEQQLLDPLSESLLPTTMSCRQAFDQAYHCNSLGGQWLSVYRTGGPRSCAEHWDDFWFCMRTRALSGGAKEAAIRDRYRRRELERYHTRDRPCSTDVWEPRAERLPRGAAFSVPYDHPDLDDEEWRRAEIEHRRRVQEGLRRAEEGKAAGEGEGEGSRNKMIAS
ncbi:hypothetical protein F4779DRAFT_379671 [Xylariaceae sp. FL0662B]|nr:hypothetical protein F4779DRAFT_379671 [Xylariaceae sp. FL0662B]